MSKSSIRAGVLGIAVLFLSCAVVTPGSAQQNFQRPATAVQPALPNSVALPAAKVKPSEVVLVIPEAQIFKGIDLTETQRKALSANLRGADFKVRTAGTLTSGELQMMRVPLAQPQFQYSMQLFPAPGEPGTAAIDPCALSEVSPAQVTALSKLIAAHLRSTGGDAAGFEANVPSACVRQHVAYMIKSAAAVMK